MIYYDRITKKQEAEPDPGQGSLRFLYNTLPGRLILKGIVIRPWFSKLGSRYQYSRLSRKDIPKFIKKHNIDLCGKNAADFGSFNDFFTREKEYSVDRDDNALIAVADSKLLIYDISDKLELRIKQSVYTLPEILGDGSAAKEFAGGKCLVFRLCVNDYHRYCFPDGGMITGSKEIKGVLHTVRPISDKYRVFAVNSRVVTYLDTKNLGKVAQIEVGAVMIGKVENRRLDTFQKGEEKGFFRYGGSTIVMLINRDVRIDPDILKANTEGLETRVRIGERIGTIIGES